MILSRSLASVRPMGPFGIGRPYILDYKRGILKPDLRSDEWARTKDKRIWTFGADQIAHRWDRLKRSVQDAFLLPSWQTNFGFSGQMQSNTPFLGYTSAATYAPATGALDTIYVYGTSGEAIYMRIPMIAAQEFDTVYFYISSYGGTAALVNTMTVEIRNDTSGKPGTTVHATIVKDPASATGWIAAQPVDGGAGKFTGSANTVYWICIGNTDVLAATNNPVVIMSMSSLGAPDLFTRWGSIATNGFATVPGLSSVPAGIVVKYTAGSIGVPYSAQANPTSSQNKRGLVMNTGLTETLSVFGFLTGPSGDVDMTAVEVFTGAALPDDAAAATWSVGLPAVTEQGFCGTPYTIPKETLTRIVMVFGGGVAVVPAKMTIGTGTTAGLRAAMLGGGDMYWTEENTTPNPDDWSNDDTSAWPKAALLIENQIAVAGGSGPVGQQCGM